MQQELIGPRDRVCCATGGGELPLHLLLANPEAVVTVDPHPVQNYLLQLKMAALRELSFERYLSFLGVRPDGDREDVLNSLLLHMNVAASLYWDRQREAVRSGIVVEKAPLPPYLTRAGTQRIKPRLCAISHHTVHLVDYLEGMPAESFDVFAIPEPDERLWQAIHRAARPGARFLTLEGFYPSSTSNFLTHLR